ncbi:MAG: hypothetical protein RL033_7407, partial [Pseudomonadota bacterium]
MSKTIEAASSGVRELSDLELAQVQGGGLLGDVWNYAKDKAKEVANAVTNAVTHPVDTLAKAADALGWVFR